MAAGPSGNGFVAFEAPSVAGFLVRPQSRDAVRLADGVQCLNNRRYAHNQRLAEVAEFRVELAQALANEIPMPRRGVRLPPKIWLDDVERQHGTALGRFREGPMIAGTQIALEPHDIQRRWHR
jgi:hypothetical protein